MELLVVMAVIAILATFAIPTMWGYIRSATVRAGAQEMRTALQQAKQLAIRNRQNICVQAGPTGYQIRQPGCGGANFWTGTGWVPAAYTFRLQNNVAVVGPGIVFTPLGAAAPGGTLTVTGPSGDVLTVTASPAGRVQTP